MSQLHLKERFRAAMPTTGKEFGQLAGSFFLMLAAKIPFTAVNLGVNKYMVEKMRENPDLLPLGIAAFSLVEVGMCLYDLNNMLKGKVGASPKANTIYRVLSLMTPRFHKGKAVTAQVGTIGMDIFGISPDLSLFYTTLESYRTGDYTIALANRLSNLAITGMFELGYNIFLKHQNKKSSASDQEIKN